MVKPQKCIEPGNGYLSKTNFKKSEVIKPLPADYTGL
jgi:hypothetical protein